jgi:hypothetical protein
MHKKYGVGPGSLLAVAVNVTEPPTAADVAVVESATLHPLLANVGVHRSLTVLGLVPVALLAVMWTVLLLDGDTATSEVGDETVTLAAGAVPKRTWVALSKPLPCTCTAVPPDHGPVIGLTDVMVGAAVAGGTVPVAVGDGAGLMVGAGDGEGLPQVTTTGVPAACAFVPALVPSSTCATYRCVEALLALTTTVAVVPLP